MAWPIKTCGICKQTPDDRGFCGCEPPFSLDAMPTEKADGIARELFPHIASFFTTFFDEPGNREKFEKWEAEYERRKREGITPTIPVFGWAS